MRLRHISCTSLHHINHVSLLQFGRDRAMLKELNKNKIMFLMLLPTLIFF